ncbi:hypothetical protein JXB41_01990, partial [Candidatus Woesearchaeota archaeon]|nr:hypothetical protein [Candidatus Woesearchaeota archaeon]
MNKEGDKKEKYRYRYIPLLKKLNLFLLILIFISVISVSTDNYISLDKPVFDVNETVVININLQEFSNTLLKIISPKQEYNFLNPVKTIRFIPRFTGRYFINLYKNSVLFDSAEFEVISDETDDSEKQVISLDKYNVTLGEKVFIKLSLDEFENKQLTIISKEKTYHMFNVFDSVVFTPVTYGLHVIELSENNEIIASSTFYVSEPVSEETGPKPGKISLKNRLNQESDFEISVYDKEGSSETLKKQLFPHKIKSFSELELPAFFNEKIDIELVSEEIPDKKLRFTGINISEDFNLKLENLNAFKINKRNSVNGFAVDPSSLEFDSAELISTAQGNELWKCAEWDFENGQCLGKWNKVMDIAPGEIYTITLTKDDPAFAEILITRAMHLDEDRISIEDVYDEVSARDNIWAEIPGEHYLRVEFEKELSSGNDITIYARSNYADARVEVYEQDRDELIAEFGIIDEDKKYQVFLTNLQGTQNTFDLKITGNPVEFDYIVDPPQKQVYDVAGSDIFTVPTGVNYITIKAWGGGGGGGGGGGTDVGADGAGGGFAQATINVTPGETLDIYVGGGGTGGEGSDSEAAGGGGGGGYSGILRNSTELVIAAGGGGGGGGDDTAGQPGNAGGAGGGTSGTDAVDEGSTSGGNGGTPIAGGEGGANGGTSGISLSGGDGGIGASGTACSDGDECGGGGGGTNGGGDGGDGTTYRGGGGGGGSGHYGGGGGGGSNDGAEGACGGGGGSSYTTGTDTSTSSGSGADAANNLDIDYQGSAGQAGSGGGTDTAGSNGNPGLVVILWDNPPNVTSLNYPADNANISTTPIEFNFTVIDDSGFSNCSLYMNISGWTIQGTTYNVQNNTNMNITSSPADGTYLWNIRCWDNATISNNDYGDSNYTVTIDSTPPRVADITFFPENQIQLNPINITVNISDLLPISSVIAQVTFPNTTKINYTMTDSDGDGIYNLTFTETFQIGQYNLTIYANDTVGNINSTEHSNFTVQLGTLSLTTDKSEYVVEETV